MVSYPRHSGYPESFHRCFVPCWTIIGKPGSPWHNPTWPTWRGEASVRYPYASPGMSCCRQVCTGKVAAKKGCGLLLSLVLSILLCNMLSTLLALPHVNLATPRQYRRPFGYTPTTTTTKNNNNSNTNGTTKQQQLQHQQQQ